MHADKSRELGDCTKRATGFCVPASHHCMVARNSLWAVGFAFDFQERNKRRFWARLQVTALYSSTRQYYMLDDLSEAMAAAKKVTAVAMPLSILVASGASILITFGVMSTFPADSAKWHLFKSEGSSTAYVPMCMLCRRRCRTARRRPWAGRQGPCRGGSARWPPASRPRTRPSCATRSSSACSR